MSFRSNIARIFIGAVVVQVFIWFFGPVTASDDPLAYAIVLFIVVTATIVIFEFIRTRMKWIGMFAMRFIRYVIALYKAERERFEDKLQGKREYKARRKRVAQDQLFDECEGVCAGCKDRFGLFRPMQIDHIIPVHQGGTNDLENQQLLCSSCASKKRVKDQLFYYTQKGLCADCKGRFDRSHLQIDHIIPVNRGGTNDLENQQLLCSSCASKDMCADCNGRFHRFHLQIDHTIPVNQGGTNDLKNQQLLCSSCALTKRRRIRGYERSIMRRISGRQRIRGYDYRRVSGERQRISKWVKPHLFQECGGECAGCMDTFRQMGNLTIDHIVPVHLGGTNDLNNLQLLCRSCNSRKGTGTMPELINRLRREGIRR